MARLREEWVPCDSLPQDWGAVRVAPRFTRGLRIAFLPGVSPHPLPVTALRKATRWGKSAYLPQDSYPYSASPLYQTPAIPSPGAVGTTILAVGSLSSTVGETYRPRGILGAVAMNGGAETALYLAASTYVPTIVCESAPPSSGFLIAASSGYTDAELLAGIAIAARLDPSNNSGQIFSKGVKSDSGATFYNFSSNPTSYSIGRAAPATPFPWSSEGLTLVAIWDAIYGDADLFELTAAPPRLFERLVLVPVAAGGASWSVDLVDAAVGADLGASTAGWSAARIEAAAGTELQAGIAVLASAQLDAAAGIDAHVSLAGLAAAAIETAAGADIRTAAATLVAAVTEATTAAELAGAAATLVSAAVEAASGADSVTSGAIASGSVVEVATASNLATALATLAATVAETATATELATAVKQAVAAVNEAAVGADVVSTGVQWTAARTEAAAGADALAATALLVAQIVEAGGGADSADASAVLLALLAEVGAGGDSAIAAAPGIYAVGLTEVATALDLIAGALAGEAPAVLPAVAGLEIFCLPRTLEINA